MTGRVEDGTWEVVGPVGALSESAGYKERYVRVAQAGVPGDVDEVEVPPHHYDVLVVRNEGLGELAAVEDLALALHAREVKRVVP